MRLTTIAKPFQAGNILILPFTHVEDIKEPRIVINNIEAVPENAVKHDARVDIMNPRTRKRCFLVEHVLGPLRLVGITNARVYGTDKTWNFLRPEHRFAYSLGLSPEFVVGEEDGTQRPGLEALVDHLSDYVVKTKCRVYKSVAEEIVHENVDPFGYKGKIIIYPRNPGEGITLSVRLFKNSLENLLITEEGLQDRALLKRILRARTPYLIGLESEEALLHAVGDVTADIVGLGGLTDVAVSVELNFFYHALTVGAIKKARFIKEVEEC
jgi:hypothetical protein